MIASTNHRPASTRHAKPRTATRLVRLAGTTLAAFLLVAAASPEADAQVCEPAGPCGDVNGSDTVTIADALGILQRSIGIDVAVECACQGGTTCDAGIVTTTGQTMCWDRFDTSNPIDPIDCPNTGQDGDASRGIASNLVDNLDGTLTDTATGLMWEKLSDDGSIHDWDNFQYQWAGAYDKMGQLNAADDGKGFAGYDDWRLPNLRELLTLINFSAYNPAVSIALNSECASLCKPEDCSCTKPTGYWTSTTSQNTPSNAWSVNFQTGALSTAGKTTYQYVRAVRGGYGE